MIVLLNGASSSGKTTLARALQRALPEPYLLHGIDTLVFALPGRWLNPPLWHEVFGYAGPPEALTITAGPVGDRLVSALFGASVVCDDCTCDTCRPDLHPWRSTSTPAYQADERVRVQLGTPVGLHCG